MCVCVRGVCVCVCEGVCVCVCVSRLQHDRDASLVEPDIPLHSLNSSAFTAQPAADSTHTPPSPTPTIATLTTVPVLLRNSTTHAQWIIGVVYFTNALLTNKAVSLLS